MDPVTRRSFLIKGSAGAVGAAGLAAGGLKLASLASDDSDDAALAFDDADAASPVLLQITDPSAGEAVLLVDEREVRITDRALVAKLLRAVR
jgi:hypothetical protein